jgi:DNA-binding NarL/FixJ family response regulator
MDIQMPGGDGLQATREIVESPGLATRVVILTTFERDEYVFEALHVGASGFLLKNAPPEQLVEAVRVVAAGVDPGPLSFTDLDVDAVYVRTDDAAIGI